MFRWVFISESMPRDLVGFNASLWEGLVLTRYMGTFFFVGGLGLMVVATVIARRPTFPGMMLLMVALAGFAVRKQVVDRAAEREQVFLHGKLLRATVKAHGRQFNPLRSSRDFTITLSRASGPEIVIVSPREELWSASPIGAEILGLEHNGATLFGQELGCEFKLFNAKTSAEAPP